MSKKATKIVKRLSVKKIKEFANTIKIASKYDSDFRLVEKGFNTTSIHSLRDAYFAFPNHDTSPFEAMIEYYNKNGIHKVDFYFLNLIVYGN